MSFRSNPSGRPFLPPGNQCQIQGQGHSPHWMMMKAHQVAMVEPCCLIGHIDDVLMLETELDILYFRNHDVASVVAALQAEGGTGTLASGVLRVWAESDHRRAHLFSLLPFRLGRLEVCEFL